MLNLDLYKRYHGSHQTEGEARKDNSVMITDQTWWRDPSACVCYVYDYSMDDEREITCGLSPQNNTQKIAIDCKYVINTYNSDEKAQVGYHLMFRPSQEDKLKDITQKLIKHYGMVEPPTGIYPIGLYVDIPDKNNVYRRYLIVDFANAYDNQTTTWSVLPCDERFNWISDNKTYKMWGCKRSISNYDSGVWHDYKTEIANDQDKLVLPFNNETSTLYYNRRIIVSAPIETPLAWKVSKVENTTPRGVNRITLIQDKFDQNYDYIEKDEDGNIVAMWANYYRSKPIDNEDSEQPEPTTDYTGVITYNGTKPQLKIGGLAKTFIVTYYDAEGNIVEFSDDVKWEFYLDDEDASSLIKATYDGNSVTVKFYGDEDYMGEVMTITADCNEVHSEIRVEITL